MSDEIKTFLRFMIIILLIIIILSSILYWCFGDIESSYKPMWRLIGNRLYYF